MKAIAIAALVAWGAVSFLLAPESARGQVAPSDYLHQLFGKFIDSNKKAYKSQDEYDYRFKIFSEQLKRLVDFGHPLGGQVKLEGSITTSTAAKVVISQGADPCRFTKSLNKFADLSDEEFDQHYLMPRSYFDKDLARAQSVLEFQQSKAFEDEISLKLNDRSYDIFDEALKAFQEKRKPGQGLAAGSEAADKFKDNLVKLLSPKSHMFIGEPAKETGLTSTCVSFLYQFRTVWNSKITVPGGTITRKTTATAFVRYSEQVSDEARVDKILGYFGRALQSDDHRRSANSGEGSFDLPQGSQDSDGGDAPTTGDNKGASALSNDSNHHDKRKRHIASDSDGSRTPVTNSDPSNDKGQYYSPQSAAVPASNERSRKDLPPTARKTGQARDAARSYLPLQAQKTSPIVIGGVQVPSYLDWRDADIISPVKDQNLCKGCYAFSAIAALEANNALYNDDYSRFSEQEILDCSEENEGCAGGLPSFVFEYVKNSGVSLERDYLYKNLPRKDLCTRRASTAKFSAVSGHVFVKRGVLSLIKALQFGPIATLSYASSEFKYYDSGVFDGEGCENQAQPNHSSLVVGYNLQSPKPYFILKNAWGPDWGDNGFYKMSIGPLTDKNLGKCLLAATGFNSFPLIKQYKS